MMDGIKEEFRPVAVAQALQIDDGFDDERLTPNTEGKHVLFFGCCCDMRKATMVINGISLVATSLALLFTMMGGGAIAQGMTDISDQLDDDYATSNLNTGEVGVGAVVGIVLAVEIVSIVFAGIGFYGALRFKMWALVTTAVVLSIRFLYNLITTASLGRYWFVNLPSILLSAMWLYPHIFMIHLMKKGIMTPSNYKNVESCCQC